MPRRRSAFTRGTLSLPWRPQARPPEAYGLGNFVYWREDDESGRSGGLLVTRPTAPTSRQLGAIGQYDFLEVADRRAVLG